MIDRIIYRTTAMLLPATPRGLLPERWGLQHQCTMCHQRVATEELMEHAKSHACTAGTGTR